MGKRARLAQWVKSQQLLKYVPNTLTLCNCICGFLAIVFMLQVYEIANMGTDNALKVFAISAWIILFAMVFDTLDGFAARIFNAASMHGMQMDSLADMVTFGVAPATICAIMTHYMKDSNIWITNLLCAMYMGGAALRLATYNVKALTKRKSSSSKFTGLPSPGAAAGVCSMALVLNFLNVEHGNEYPMFAKLAGYIPVYAAVLGVLMVSPFEYPHLGRMFFSIWRNPKRLFVLIMVLTIVAFFRTRGLFVLINLYIMLGPINYAYGLLQRKKGAE